LSDPAHLAGQQLAGGRGEGGEEGGNQGAKERIIEGEWVKEEEEEEEEGDLGDVRGK